MELKIRFVMALILNFLCLSYSGETREAKFIVHVACEKSQYYEKSDGSIDSGMTRFFERQTVGTLALQIQADLAPDGTVHSHGIGKVNEFRPLVLNFSGLSSNEGKLLLGGDEIASEDKVRDLNIGKHGIGKYSFKLTYHWPEGGNKEILGSIDCNLKDSKKKIQIDVTVREHGDTGIVLVTKYSGVKSLWANGIIKNYPNINFGGIFYNPESKPADCIDSELKY